MRRLRTTDFSNAAQKRMGGRQPAQWWVGKYELRENGLIDATSRATEWKSYKPLEEFRDLFLTFAHLFEAEDLAANITEWVSSFGLPIQFFYEDIFGELSFSTLLADQYDRELAGNTRTLAEFDENTWSVGSETGWFNSRRSPPSVTLEDLRTEIWEAWDILAHYEAHINSAADRVLFLPDGEAHPRYKDILDRLQIEKVSGIVLERARDVVESAVTSKVNEHCFLVPLANEFNERLQSRWAWGFHDLRGAMYLQMLWVMESGIKVGRTCKKCHTELRMTGPKGNKSPARKEFCGDACRVAYNRGKA